MLVQGQLLGQYINNRAVARTNATFTMKDLEGSFHHVEQAYPVGTNAFTYVTAFNIIKK